MFCFVQDDCDHQKQEDEHEEEQEEETFTILDVKVGPSFVHPTEEAVDEDIPVGDRGRSRGRGLNNERASGPGPAFFALVGSLAISA